MSSKSTTAIKKSKKENKKINIGKEVEQLDCLYIADGVYNGMTAVEHCLSVPLKVNHRNKPFYYWEYTQDN
jgi:hypothetical protein